MDELETTEFPDTGTLTNLELPPGPLDCAIIVKYIYVVIGLIAVIGIGVPLLSNIFSFWEKRKKYARWGNTKENLVIVHTFPSAILIPNASHFSMKLMTYLRMANIPYEIDTKDYSGPKGKAPWISLNGEHVADSHFIIKFLNEKFQKKPNGYYSEDQLAVATSLRIMMEEYAFWGSALYRLDYCIDSFSKIIDLAPLWLIKLTVARQRKAEAYVQGLGRHTEAEVRELMLDCLRSLSRIMGKNKFVLGDEPCEDDAAIFGVLSQFYFALPGSPFGQYFEGELNNLKEYCLRMKDLFWPDWEECLDKA